MPHLLLTHLDRVATDLSSPSKDTLEADQKVLREGGPGPDAEAVSIWYTGGTY